MICLNGDFFLKAICFTNTTDMMLVTYLWPHQMIYRVTLPLQSELLSHMVSCSGLFAKL